jgi:hypothetical protein
LLPLLLRLRLPLPLPLPVPMARQTMRQSRTMLAQSAEIRLVLVLLRGRQGWWKGQYRQRGHC